MDGAIVDGKNEAISFAKQCVNIYSQEAQKMGVISHNKLKNERQKESD